MNNKTEISARLQQMLDYLNVNPTDFAKKLNYSRPQTIYDILNGRINPSYDFFHKLEVSEYSNIFSFRWFIGGKGEMLKENSPLSSTNIQGKTANATIECQEVPLYDISAITNFRDLFTNKIPLNVLQTIKIPNLPRRDGALPVIVYINEEIILE
jgi:hypothetical protein